MKNRYCWKTFCLLFIFLFTKNVFAGFGGGKDKPRGASRHHQSLLDQDDHSDVVVGDTQSIDASCKVEDSSSEMSLDFLNAISTSAVIENTENGPQLKIKGLIKHCIKLKVSWARVNGNIVYKIFNDSLKGRSQKTFIKRYTACLEEKGFLTENGDDSEPDWKKLKDDKHGGVSNFEDYKISFPIPNKVSKDAKAYLAVSDYDSLNSEEGLEEFKKLNKKWKCTKVVEIGNDPIYLDKESRNNNFIAQQLEEDYQRACSNGNLNELRQVYIRSKDVKGFSDARENMRTVLGSMRKSQTKEIFKELKALEKAIVNYSKSKDDDDDEDDEKELEEYVEEYIKQLDKLNKIVDPMIEELKSLNKSLKGKITKKQKKKIEKRIRKLSKEIAKYAGHVDGNLKWAKMMRGLLKNEDSDISSQALRIESFRARSAYFGSKDKRKDKPTEKRFRKFKKRRIARLEKKIERETERRAIRDGSGAKYVKRARNRAKRFKIRRDKTYTDYQEKVARNKRYCSYGIFSPVNPARCNRWQRGGNKRAYEDMSFNYNIANQRLRSANTSYNSYLQDDRYGRTQRAQASRNYYNRNGNTRFGYDDPLGLDNTPNYNYRRQAQVPRQNYSISAQGQVGNQWMNRYNPQQRYVPIMSQGRNPTQAWANQYTVPQQYQQQGVRTPAPSLYYPTNRTPAANFQYPGGQGSLRINTNNLFNFR